MLAAAPCPGPVMSRMFASVRRDEPVQVGIDEIDAGRRSPVPEQPLLDVLRRERLLEQRVGFQVDLGHRQVIHRPAVPSNRFEVGRGPSRDVLHLRNAIRPGRVESRASGVS